MFTLDDGTAGKEATRQFLQDLIVAMMPRFYVEHVIGYKVEPFESETKAMEDAHARFKAACCIR